MAYCAELRYRSMHYILGLRGILQKSLDKRKTTNVAAELLRAKYLHVIYSNLIFPIAFVSPKGRLCLVVLL